MYPLHSSLSNEEQQAVFTRPPEGVTKIIISTNIAETSVTIDDVVYVIDSGRMKEKRLEMLQYMALQDWSWAILCKTIHELYCTVSIHCYLNGLCMFRYDASRSMESLEDVWVSRANALQRRGRAGRVASGVCFHLFTSHRFTHHLSQQQLPEIQRVPLEQLCLRYVGASSFSESPVGFQQCSTSLLNPYTN